LAAGGRQPTVLRRPALLIVLAPHAAGANAELIYGQGLPWRVDRAGGVPSHLFGTMHSNDPDITRLPEPVASAPRHT
jgi:uncharacterized protein YbaP (TraB family)